MERASVFAQTLRQHRHGRGLTQAALAERAGLSERGISDLERGLKQPQRTTVRMLVGALDLSPDQAERFEMAARSMPVSTDAPDRPIKHNLPVALTTFIGREQAIAELQQRIGGRAAGQPRLITLTGAGGCGKTRLSLEVAWRVADAFADGARFVDLSAISDGHMVAATVLNACGVREAPGQTTLEALLRFAQTRSLLLVLDNCEHLVQECAELVDALLRGTIQVQILATSRELLRVPGEMAWRVPSLSAPHPTENLDARTLAEYEAVHLFVQRFLLVQSQFQLDATSAQAVGQICGRLDGIPLAIELAAARGVAMSVQDLAARLDDRFRLLTGGSRVALPRHRTLHATIDWSHELLDPRERLLFRRLSVFAGGWTFEAVEEVCADAVLHRREILDLHLRLVDQSLVSFHEQAGGTRYRFLETVRAYALERLEQSGELDALRARHRDWFVAFAERAAIGLGGGDQQVWFRQLVTEHDNIRAALEACRLEPEDRHLELRLAAAMGQFWRLQHPTEGRRRLSEALARATSAPSSARAAALIWQASIELLYGDPAVGRSLAEDCLAVSRAVGDHHRAAHALRQMALATTDADVTTRLAYLREGLEFARAGGADSEASMLLAFIAAHLAEANELQEVGALVAEGVALAERSQDAFGWVQPLYQLGWLAVVENRLEDAENTFRFTLQVAERIGYDSAAGFALLALGQVELRRQNIDQARELHLKALSTLSSAGGAYLASALVYVASVEMAAGQPLRAQRLMGASEVWHAARGGANRVWLPVTHGALKRGLVAVPALPHDPEHIRARQQGREMTLDGAVAWVLHELRGGVAHVT